MFGAQLRLLGDVAFSVESLFSSSCHQVSMNRESDDSKVIHLLKKYFYEVIVTMQGRKIKYFDTKVKTTIQFKLFKLKVLF